MLEQTELAELYERYGYLVHRRCLALLRNASDADDALQETFWRVQKYGRPRDAQATLAWLYTIAANCAFDLGRRKGRETAEDPAVLARSGQATSGSAADGDRRAVVGAILKRFDETTRTIGVLHHLDGFTQEEIATQTGYSRKTIGKKLADFETRFTQWWNQATGKPA